MRTTASSHGAWVDDERLVLAGVEFLVTFDADRYMSERSTPERFVVAKARSMVDLTSDVVEELQARRIVELGIFKGGSTALLASLARPERLTAVELETERVKPLDTFLAQHDLRDAVTCHYGVDQGDRGALERIVHEDHGDEPLDLVVDDASHLLRQTRTSFEVLFPRLRPGGVFLLEDWAWAHFPGSLWQEGGGYFHDRPALTNLLVELMMVVGSQGDLIADVTVTPGIALIKRGPAPIDGSIRLEEHYLNRGLPFRPLL